MSGDLRANERPQNKLHGKGTYTYIYIYISTRKQTLQLRDQIGPVGRFGENCWLCTETKEQNTNHLLG